MLAEFRKVFLLGDEHRALVLRYGLKGHAKEKVIDDARLGGSQEDLDARSAGWLAASQSQAGAKSKLLTGSGIDRGAHSLF